MVPRVQRSRPVLHLLAHSYHDGRVAAICVAHGVEKLLTRDREFALFPELRTENPF
jgi:predicted nucleic acid-binding protein